MALIFPSWFQIPSLYKPRKANRVTGVTRLGTGMDTYSTFFSQKIGTLLHSIMKDEVDAMYRRWFVWARRISLSAIMCARFSLC